MVTPRFGDFPYFCCIHRASPGAIQIASLRDFGKELLKKKGKVF